MTFWNRHRASERSCYYRKPHNNVQNGTVAEDA